MKESVQRFAINRIYKKTVYQMIAQRIWVIWYKIKTITTIKNTIFDLK